MADEFIIYYLPPDRSSALELSELVEAATWTTNAVGGFGSCTLTLPGPPDYWQKRLPKLGLVRIDQGASRAWEGQVEDHTLVIGEGDIHTEVQVFGLGRILSEISVRRVWSMRTLPWSQLNLPAGAAALTKAALGAIAIATGSFDPTNLATAGVQGAGTGVSIALNAGDWADYRLPTGLTAQRIMFDFAVGGVGGGASMQGCVLESSDGAAWSLTKYLAANVGPVSQALASRTQIRLGMFNNAAAFTPTAADFVQYKNIRLLGTTLTEDVAGGFYGGTILRDLIALCPGLSIGVIEDGTDFTIQSIERTIRDYALSVVQEVAGYYAAREWAVWEDGAFNWQTANFDDAGWLLDLNQLTSLQMTTSLDPMASTDYVLYSDAASGLTAEQSAASVSPQNPYVKIGRTKDVLTTPGFPMTSNTGSGLASALNTQHGQRPVGSGTITLPASRKVINVRGGMKAAGLIRGGDNVKLIGLPKDDAFALGREGQTIFHVVATSTDLKGETTLTLDSQTRSTEVILARLAAVTRTLTG